MEKISTGPPSQSRKAKMPSKPGTMRFLFTTGITPRLVSRLGTSLSWCGRVPLSWELVLPKGKFLALGRNTNFY